VLLLLSEVSTSVFRNAEVPKVGISDDQSSDVPKIGVSDYRSAGMPMFSISDSRSAEFWHFGSPILARKEFLFCLCI